MFTALYRAYRPQKFSEVAGQSSAVSVLEKELSTGRTAHAYLFSGARGCGKTTAARLMAKALNCTNLFDGYEPCCECQGCVSIAGGENLDVIEIDGASNNGVEEIRELKTHVALAPFGSRLKIYIIDEVHMLSTAAFNALLKTLEEPPAHVVFILATTEPHKVPVTIRSRCQHIPFHRISPHDTCERLKIVCKAENLEYEDEAIWEIARNSDGALRDALSLLDQVASLGKGKVLLDDVSELMGGGSLPALERWLSAWRTGDAEAFRVLDDMFQRGASPQRTLEELFSLARNLWVVHNWGTKSVEAFVSSSEREYLERESKNWDAKPLERFMIFLSKLIPSARAGMRTDVLVGIIMARRDEILNGAEQATSPPTTSPPNPLPINGEGEQSQSKSKKQDLLPSSPSPFMERGLGGEVVLPEFLARAKHENFALSCALLSANITELGEDEKNFCISTDEEYIFHVLSGGKNPGIISALLKEKYPECKVFLKYKELIHECKASFPSVIAKKEKEKKAEITKIPDTAEPEKTNAPESSNALQAVQNVLKFVRGEVIIHKKEKEQPEDGGESEEES